ncbi:hypothetical protein CEE44_02970 [Candidatus Woesearchaeota archaeon B3_Woes]|nr:MAG: hypothetical protein CEE44_02970 [Candidatus Woesearchaeota archaeon B3_Woes]
MGEMVMFSFRNFISKFRHYFRFNKSEIEASVISVLVLAFIVSFGEWGAGDAFDFNVGLINLFESIIIVGIVLGSHLIVIKLIALYWGYRAEFKLWWYGLLTGLGLAFFSASLTGSVGHPFVLWVLAPGGIFFHHMSVHRLGWFRYGVNMIETGLCCMWGSLSTVFLALFFKILLVVFPGSLFFYKGMVVSLWFAFFSILPIPPLNGSRLFFYSRATYAFVFGSILGATFLIISNLNIFLIILLSLVVGVIIWVLHLWKVEAV